MMQSSKNNGFTIADIERYHAGQLSAAEMHALEKAAMEDPFLADALEGYAHTANPAADLQALHERLEQKTRRVKTIPFLLRNRNWMSAAAILLVVAGTGWITLRLLSSNNETIALDRTQPKQENREAVVQSPVVRNDSTIIKIDTGSDVKAPGQADAVSMTESSKIQTRKSISAKNSQNTNENEDRQFLAASEEERPVITSEPAAEMAIPETANNNLQKRSNTGNVQPGLATGNNRNIAQGGNPAANAANSENSYALRRRQADNQMQREAPYAKRDASPVQNQNLAASDTIRNFDVVLKEEKLSADEVVVIGYGKKKDAAASNKYPHVVVDTLEPAEGYIQLDEYVAANLKMPEELKEKTSKGEVKLAFEVNREGQPINITVVKSLCKTCDEEAIRILREGPRWKKKNNKKGLITIKF
jgi:hypothetical protein